jgi:hypothetical protein
LRNQKDKDMNAALFCMRWRVRNASDGTGLLTTYRLFMIYQLNDEKHYSASVSANSYLAQGKLRSK